MSQDLKDEQKAIIEALKKGDDVKLEQIFDTGEILEKKLEADYKEAMQEFSRNSGKFIPRRIKFLLYQKGGALGKEFVTANLVNFTNNNNKDFPFERWKDWVDHFPTDLPIPQLNKFLRGVATNIHSTVDHQKKFRYLIEKMAQNDFCASLCWNDPASEYLSTVAHTLITNENFEALKDLFSLIDEFHLPFDYTIKDKEGKTIALTAIKMCIVDIELIKKMLTKDTILAADNNGVTPLMLACVTGRLDLAMYIISFVKELIRSGELSVTLENFLNMQDKSGRTAVHYCFMREGTNEDTEQNTLGGILQSIYVDKDRDYSAGRNAFMSSPREALEKAIILLFAPTLLPKLKLTSTFIDGTEHKMNGLLCCQQNVLFLQQSGLLSSNAYISQQIKRLKNKSVAEYAMEHRQAIFKLLQETGADLSIKHSQGRSPTEMLESFKSRNDITDLDRKDLLQSISSKDATPPAKPSSVPTLDFADRKNLIKAELKRISGKDWLVNITKGIAGFQDKDKQLVDGIYQFFKQFEVQVTQGQAGKTDLYMVQIGNINLETLKRIPSILQPLSYLSAMDSKI